MTLHPQTITSDRLEELLADDSIPTVHRALWLLLWEGELPVFELLSLDVRDVRPDNGKAKPSERAAGLLAELIGDRTEGPLLTDGNRALTWDRAVQAAQEHGHAIHAFRIGGKLHRRTLPGVPSPRSGSGAPQQQVALP